MTEFEKELVRFVSGYMDAGVSAEDYVKTFAERLLGVAKEELISRQIVKAESVTETPKELEEASCKYHRTHTDEVMDYDGYHNGNTKEVYDVTPGDAFIAGAKWQKEQTMIQWTGNNLKDLIEFTGKSPRFNKWFKSWDDYEDYVRQHGNIFKMFNDDGSHLEVPVCAWIVKTPDKQCVASKFTLKQPESEKIAAAYQLGLADKEKQMMKGAVEVEVTETCGISSLWIKTKQFKPGQKVKIIIVKED